MKIKLFILGLSLGISILSGCNDDLTQVGTGIQPENDRPLVYADTFYMKAKTLQTDSVYARTIYGSLGEIYDPLYGNLIVCVSSTVRKIIGSGIPPTTT